MKYYLLKRTTLYFDGHGSSSEGKVELEVSSSEEYPNILVARDYIEDYEDEDLVEFVEDDDLYPQDGYHCRREIYSFKLIEKEDIPKIKKVIEEYNKLDEGYQSCF